MAGGVHAGSRGGEAALELGPPPLDVVAAPDAVIPADVHDAQPHGVAIRDAELVRTEQPLKERLGVRALLAHPGAGHPVEGPALLVLALAADAARARDPHRLVLSVRRLDEVGKRLGAGLGRGVALRLTLVGRRHVVLPLRKGRGDGRHRRGWQAGTGDRRTGHFAGPGRGRPHIRAVRRSGDRGDDQPHAEESADRQPRREDPPPRAGATRRGKAPQAAGKHGTTLSRKLRK